MPKIILEGHIVVSDADLPAVMAELPTHVQLTRQEAGCLCFHVNQSEEADNVFYVYEEFIDQGAFEEHQRRVQSSNWGIAAANVQRHYQVTKAE